MLAAWQAPLELLAPDVLGRGAGPKSAAPTREQNRESEIKHYCHTATYSQLRYAKPATSILGAPHPRFLECSFGRLRSHPGASKTTAHPNTSSIPTTIVETAPLTSHRFVYDAHATEFFVLTLRRSHATAFL